MAEEDIQEQEDAPDVEHDAPDPKIEAKALDLGWLPKDKFKGDPAKWRPAAEFIERGETLLPLIKAENRKLEKQLAEAQRDFKEELKRVQGTMRTALKMERDRLEAEFKERKEKAVELGDVDAYRKASEAEEKALKKLTDKAEDAADKKEDDKPGMTAEQKAWFADNKWFEAEPRMRAYALAINHDVLDEMPAASEAEQLAEVRKRVEEKFPEKFGKKRGEPVSRVESGSRMTGEGGGSSKGWQSLDKSIRDMADDLIKSDGLFLSDEARSELKKTGKVSDTELGKARARYAADYHAQG